MRSYLLGIVFALAFILRSFAHEGHHHPDPRAFGGIMPQLSADGETLCFRTRGRFGKWPEAAE